MLSKKLSQLKATKTIKQNKTLNGQILRKISLVEIMAKISLAVVYFWIYQYCTVLISFIMLLLISRWDLLYKWLPIIQTHIN